MAEQKAKLKSSGWNSLFQNPLIFGIKKYLSEVLKHRYPENERIIEQLASQILTESQYEEFGKLIASIYEAGYLKSVEDHQDQLSRLGFKANVVSKSSTEEHKPLFPQEKSG